MGLLSISVCLAGVVGLNGSVKATDVSPGGGIGIRITVNGKRVRRCIWLEVA